MSEIDIRPLNPTSPTSPSGHAFVSPIRSLLAVVVMYGHTTDTASNENGVTFDICTVCPECGSRYVSFCLGVSDRTFIRTCTRMSCGSSRTTHGPQNGAGFFAAAFVVSPAVFAGVCFGCLGCRGWRGWDWPGVCPGVWPGVWPGVFGSLGAGFVGCGAGALGSVVGVAGVVCPPVPTASPHTTAITPAIDI